MAETTSTNVENSVQKDEEMIESMDAEPTTKKEHDSSSDSDVEESKEGEETDITGDQGVMKKIIKAGEGWRTPEKGFEVIVHYVGKLLDGTVFDSSRDRNEEFRFKLGKGEVIKGWDEGVARMKKGEIALLTCKPEYAYGEAGSPPKIPANATLQFEVELINWIEEKDVSDNKDGGVMKKILKEGDGWETPKDDAKVKVNYKALLSDGTVKEEKSDFEFVIGEEQVILGLEQAVKSMKKGEKALLFVKPEYLTGISFEVPNGEVVKYEVELLEFEKEKSSWDMNFEEKFEVATKRKNEGNQLFSAQKFERAIKKYKKSLDFFQYDSGLKDEEKTKANEIKIPCYLNIAASFMKTKKYKDAIENCTKALDIDKSNVKAMFRRGTCYTEIDDWDAAKKDLNKALELDPENKDVKKQLLVLKNRIKAQNQKDKKIYAGMFEKFAQKDQKKEQLKKKDEPTTNESKEVPMEVKDNSANAQPIEVAN